MDDNIECIDYKDHVAYVDCIEDIDHVDYIDIDKIRLDGCVNWDEYVGVGQKVRPRDSDSGRESFTSMPHDHSYPQL